MREYIAETGGRYTYSDDILNLQELALSMTAMFEGCSNFILSGCETTGREITPGFVWINGKIRRFQGCRDAVFPYYIYEKNDSDTVSYANEVNKRGRCNFLCTGGVSVPNLPDALTGLVPGFIELKADYSPRLIDQFFGKYAALLETPFARQTIKKELLLTGKLSGEKDIESKTALAVVHPSNGYALKNRINPAGDASIALCADGLPVHEILIRTDGGFCFINKGQEIARISDSGVTSSHSCVKSSLTGYILMRGSHIVNSEDATDEGAIHINAAGYQNGGTTFRNFNVYNGKSSSVPLFQVAGKTAAVTVNALLEVNNTGNGIRLSNRAYSKTDKRLTNLLTWTDSAGEAIALVGYDTENTFDFTCKNRLGNITVSPNGYLNITGELKINGTTIGSIYVAQTTFDTELEKKITVVAGKGLSTEDFTTECKNKLEAITTGNLTGGNGYALASEVREETAKKLEKAENLSDLQDKAQARSHISVYSKAEMDTLLAGKLETSAAYTGVIFTQEHNTKLDGIKTGTFLSEGVSQSEGYALISAVVTQLQKKANLLLDGYNDHQKATIADNLNVYQKAAADSRFATLGNAFQDYMAYLVKEGKTTMEAQKMLRDKLDAPGKEELTEQYIRKDRKLSDLALTGTEDQKLVCQKLGAAFAADYQAKLVDTGWLQMSNSGNDTDTSKLFIRQIGNVVCIQGIINTAKRDGSNWGGTVAVIPNQVSPPKYGLRISCTDYNDDHKNNRGASFVIQGNTRKILIYESGWYNTTTEIHFTYMT
jgi:hypothetical protein